MNCPSKTDDKELLEHPTWNQNPPFLASDLTTRQDLNGIANAREYRNGGEVNEGLGLLDAKNEVFDSDISPDSLGLVATNPEEGPYGPSSMKTAGRYNAGPEARLHVADQTTPSRRYTLWDWVVWSASVLVCSYLLSALQTSRLPFYHHHTTSNPIDTTAALPPGEPNIARPTIRQRSTCADVAIGPGDYDIPLHVGALFIILAVSTGACTFPLLAVRFPSLKVPATFFFVVRHFGTGVLISTAFVHLLPTAFILLGDPCLSDFWVNDYPAMPGAIALAGVFVVIVIEMVFHPSRHMDFGAAPIITVDTPPATPTPRSMTPTGEHAPVDDSLVISNLPPPSPTPSRELDVEKSSHSDISYIILTPEQKLKKDVLQCILLEVGILFHSVFIGMALSVSIGSEFIVLLIAIAFHQTFEGLALGSRIATIAWPKGTPQPWFMAFAYGCTTPIGQAIGIGISSLYSPGSEVGLILVGTMNAISAGLLVFASLVELLSEDFLSYESWRVLRGKKRVMGCLLVFGGAFCMSLVGAWA